MFGPLHFHLTRSARRLVVWCLLVSVPMYGLSISLVELLGSQHVHRNSTDMVSATPPSATRANDAFGGLVDFRRLPSGHAHAEHGHSHDAFQRHHHEPADATVIALDGGHSDGASSDEGGSSAVSHVLALSTPAALTVAPLPAFTWPAAPPPAIHPWIADGMERPPKA